MQSRRLRVRLVARSPYKCEQPSGSWSGRSPSDLSITSLPEAARIPLSIDCDLLTSQCIGKYYRARFEINNPNGSPLIYVASEILVLEVLELKYLDRRHPFPSEHSPWGIVAQLH